jgi:hypothetical protein
MLRFLRSLIRRDARRDHRHALLRSLPRNAVCAEVGVWKGDFSQRILAVTRPRELHLIDPWQFRGELPDRWYGGLLAKCQSDMDAIYDDVARTMGHKAIIHRGTSEEVLRTMADGYFDWIYIDGDHGYAGVLRDLELGWQKVRAGGYIAGDDFDWGKRQGFPVRRAVEEFIEKHNVADQLTMFGSQFRIRVT